MLKIATCLTQQHNLALVGLAGFVCLFASHCALIVARRAAACSGRSRWMWCFVAGLSGGFGIWSTHFIAMLAYNPGLDLDFRGDLTFASLFLAIFATLLAVALKAYHGTKVGAVTAGAVYGAGVGLMHYTGMLALNFSSEIHWDWGYVLASFALGMSLSSGAFIAQDAATPTKTKALPTLLLTLSVVSLHFTAMGGITIVALASDVTGSALLSPAVMATVIALVSLSLLCAGFAAATFAIKADETKTRAERNFKLLVQGVTDYAIYMLDLQGRITNWNAGAERLTGYAAQDVIGQSFGIFYSQRQREEGTPDSVLLQARNLGKFGTEGWYIRRNGSLFWAHVVVEPIHDEDGVTIGYANILKDDTQRKRDGDRIAKVTANLDIALENMGQGICLFDDQERLVICNQRYLSIFRFAENSVEPGMEYKQIVRVGYLAHAKDIATALLHADDHYQRNIAFVRSGGGVTTHKYPSGMAVQQIVNPLPDGGWVATFEDITERVEAEEKIAFLAKHDALTALPNRLQFNERLRSEISVADRIGERLAVIGVDLDGFKEINDQHGHAIGDLVLSTLAQRLEEIRSDGEFVARLGGDEFAAFKSFDEVGELHNFISRLEKSLAASLVIDDCEVKTGASIGVAIYPSDADTAEALLSNADLAMYRAKNSLLQTVCFYEASMDEAARTRRSMTLDLWDALKRAEFHLHYQVQKSVITGQITGYEVLLRWLHPTRGNIPPLEFIGLAEQCGAILPIGEWVLREACREAASWNNKHKVAVNLSPVQLGHADMATLVATVLLETGLEPGRLEIEITESTIITDKVSALHTLRQIKALGVGIAIDDFGTGYSSLETLRSFPFDKIKLDKSFMNDVETSPQSKAIVRAILALGQSLEVPVLAEGVETQAQLDILLQERCDEAQGYLFGRPKPIEEVATEQAA